MDELVGNLILPLELRCLSFVLIQTLRPPTPPQFFFTEGQICRNEFVLWSIPVPKQSNVSDT